MSKRFKKMLALICCFAMLSSLFTVSASANTDDTETSAMNETPTAMFGTPELGSDDPLWALTMEHLINKSTVPDDPRPLATGTARILWDDNYVYARVVVEDSDVYQGSGADHTYDSIEFFVGTGSSGSNQWRVSTTGLFSGQSHTDRAAWTQITDTGYIVEMRIPKRTLVLEPGMLTFEVNINNSTATGADRYEVVSAFGDPDTGFNSDAAFRDSLELILANEVDTRHSITLSADTGGKITPNVIGNVMRVTPGSDLTFTVTPDNGKVVGTATVDGEAVTLSNDNTFTLSNISADHNIHVTFNDDSSANQLPFIVWNDNFASGEYTTAVIIDLGEGQEASGSALDPSMFTVSARNTTLVDELVVLEKTHRISRIYANNEPKVRGYLGKVHNSPDYQEGLASGRYIVVEFEFYTEVGGNTTLDASNSTNQNYNIVQNSDIVLTEGEPLNYVVFKQENVVNPILDKFTTHTSEEEVNYARYLHKDENGDALEAMPLYIFTHGFSRGGTQAHIDQKASMKSANGAVALMKRIEKNPEKYASHILNISYSGGSSPQATNIKLIIDELIEEGLVDPNRIYVAGFSMGGGVTTSLLNTYPGFFAAAAPMGISSWPSVNTSEAHKDLAYWVFVNTYDSGASNIDNVTEDFAQLTNARASRFDSNEALSWPYNQYDQPSQRPNMANDPPLARYIAHEVEAAVLYNGITMEHPFTGETWSIAPIAQSPSLQAWDGQYTDVFDWMFSQSKLGEIPNEPEPDSPTAMFGTPELGSNDPLWSKTNEYPINRSTVPDDPRPHTTGTVKVLWDNDHVYARVVVEDSNLYQGPGANHTYDSLEFYLGSGSNGSNQWRVSATGVFSGQSHTDRAAWTEITDTGYIVEMRIPKRDLTLEPGNLTFDVYINNSSATGADRYEVVSAFGNPDTGFGGDAAFRDSLELISANEVDTRHSISISADTGGSITPNAPGNVMRVENGESVTFTVTPDHGKIIDAVTVNDETIAISSDNTFTLTDISADQEVRVTFKDDPAADQLPFIVWNDNFASGEYTTAVIIDLGEGQEAVGSELDKDMFDVSARNTTLIGDTVVFEGARKITRVYANDEPKVRGYVGKVSNSPDYQEGLESGRYIVVEFEFYTEVGGSTTLDGSSNSTRQNYNIVQNDDIVLTEGEPLSYAVFKQENVVNPILDKFTTYSSDSVNRSVYLHEDENGEVLQGLPLYVYTHGGSRGGTQSQFDQKAAMKSANGAVALMKKMEENPEKYASHILNISYSAGMPNADNVKKVIDDLVASGAVDPNRIYAAGFSLGGMFTNNLINAFPGFFAAAAPMAPVSGLPNSETDDYPHADLAYWMFNNVHNVGIYQTNHNNFVENNILKMTNARASNFESNEAFTWPYNQFDQPSQRPIPANTPVMEDYIAHEVEAAVLYNQITMDHPFSEETWSIAPIAQSPNLPAWNGQYTDVFDWMFSQSKLGEIPNEPEPDSPTATFGTPELGASDPLWSKTMEYPINKSTVPDDSRPHATGTVRVLWDSDYVYARVAVVDSNLYQGSGPDHMYDSLEFYVGPGSSGSNQWRVSATGVFSGQSHTDRAAWTEITDTGYIVEMRIPKRDLNLEPGKFTFEVYINNSTETGGDRYEVVSAFGNPDTGFSGHAAFADSLELILADEVDTRFSITTTTGMGGTITPKAPGNVLRVLPGSDRTFTVIPDHGKIVDNVTVNDEAVTVSNDNTFTLTNIIADQNIHVSFKDDPAADQLPFIVWNDNFASGEYTTAVIIDVGEGKKALGSELNPDLFTVSARNTTLVEDSVVFEGTRKISRVYANDEPKVRGYKGTVHNSPDYQDGLESGRYIVVEFEFYTEVGGNTTLDASNSTKQNYNIVQHDDIVLTEGEPLNYVVFKQENVVNPILDKFTTHTSEEGVNYARYLHKDENGDALEAMPLYIFTHGFSRGGTQAHIDQKASMKSANGAVALMQRMVKDSNRYASHILNISYSGGSAPQASNIKLIIDELIEEGLVDTNRIYVAGFSMGGGVTTSLLNTYPGFFAAAAPMGISSWPSVNTSEAHKDLAYWVFVNTYDSGASNIDNVTEDFAQLTNARASRFDSNEALSWPYNQYDQPSQRPNMANDPPLVRYIAHEVEAAVLYNGITMENPFTEETWSIAPIAQSPNLPVWNGQYTDVFDWMFSQSKPRKQPDTPTGPPSGNTGNTGSDTETDAPKPTYTVNTPKDKPAITDKNGNSTLPGGGEIVTENGTKINVPEGTTIDSKGKVTIPADKSAEVILPGNSGIALNIHEGTMLMLDDETALGFIVVSGNPFNDVNDDKWYYSYVNSAYTFSLFDGTSSTTFSPGTSMTRAMFVQVLANLENVDRSDNSNSRFSDVADGQWYTAAVEWAAESGIVNGISADLFNPNESMTREQMLVVLYNYLSYKGYELPQSQAKSFADESEISPWALEAVRALQGIDIVTGKGNNIFDPKGTATRAEVATVFARFIEYLAK